MNNFSKYKKIEKKDFNLDKKTYKQLVYSVKNYSGRNNSGKITVRNRCRGAKKLYRKVNFFKNYLVNTFGFLIKLNYDPYRNNFVGLICHYKKLFINQEEFLFKKFFSYSLIAENSKIYDKIIYSRDIVPLKLNNSTILLNIPKKINFFNVEFKANRGGKLARSAGTSCKLIKKYKYFSEIKIPSKKSIFLSNMCFVTLGEASNVDFKFYKKWKASQNFYLGRRPKVRGVAKNPVDHPHGGGEGKTSGGRPGGISPWGKLTKGVKTLSKNKKKLRDKNFAKKYEI